MSLIKHTSRPASSDQQEISGIHASTEKKSRRTGRRSENADKPSEREEKELRKAEKHSKKADRQSGKTGKPNSSLDKKCKRLIRYYLQLISLPLILAYYELILQFVRGSNISLFYPVFFAAGIGLILTPLLACLPKKVYLAVKGALIGILAVIFIAECLIRSSFQQYMTFSAILNGTAGIAEHYSGQAFAAIISGIPLIILYLLPMGLFIFCYKKWRIKVYQPLMKKVFLGAVGCLLVLTAWIVATVGPSESLYRESYTFNGATQKFGLLTGIRLDTQYALFGNKYQSDFVIPDSSEAAVPAVAAESSAEPETPAEESEIAQEDTAVNPYASGPTAYDELNVMNIDFDSLISSASGDEVLQEMHQYVSSLSGSHKNNYTGAFAGKNLILITAEALSDCAVDENLTPTLYRMANNGIKFEDYYQPSWGGSTSTGEFSFVTGLIPLDCESTILETVNNNLYFTLGNSLQRQNYYSRAFHNGDAEFYGRYQTHTNLGYSEFIATGQNLESITGYSYPADTVMFSDTVDTYIGNSPFSIYYMTLSGHSNYEPNAFTEEYLDIVNQYYGDRYMDTTKYYLCYQMELDRALNILISKLEEAGIADDTVIALCPDHYPYSLEQSATFGNDQDYLADLYGYVYTNWWELDHSVGIIWSECMEKDPSEEGYVAPATISSVSYSIDMVPTLLNLFGIEFDSRLLPGRDVLDPTTEGFVVWENHSWLTDYIYHDSDSNQNYLTDGSGQLAGSEWDDYIAQKTAEANNKIIYSGRVVSNNYFGVLFGDDTNF